MDKLNSWFQPEDRLAIMYIPLSTIDTNDRLIWAENRSGKFTIKSAYALALEEEQHTAMGDCLNGLACRKIGKAIWHLNVPQKIKHFAWRASRDILTTKANLAKRKIAPSGIYELCGKEEEMVNHLLWFCDHAKGVWMTSKFCFRLKSLRVGTSWMWWRIYKSGMIPVLGCSRRSSRSSRVSGKIGTFFGWVEKERPVVPF